MTLNVDRGLGRCEIFPTDLDTRCRHDKLVSKITNLFSSNISTVGAGQVLGLSWRSLTDTHLTVREHSWGGREGHPLSLSHCTEGSELIVKQYLAKTKRQHAVQISKIDSRKIPNLLIYSNTMS